LVNILDMDDYLMNHRPSGSLPVSKAIVGFLNFKTAEAYLIARSIRINASCKSGWNIWGIKKLPQSRLEN